MILILVCDKLNDGVLVNNCIIVACNSHKSNHRLGARGELRALCPFEDTTSAKQEVLDDARVPVTGFLLIRIDPPTDPLKKAVNRLFWEG